MNKNMPKDPRSLIWLSAGLLALLFLFLTGRPYAISLPLVFVQIFALLLILWSFLAIRAHKPHRESHLPKDIHYATTGPYEIIRHPVYAGILLYVSSLVQEEFTLWRLLAFVVLVLVVLARIVREEYILEQHVKSFAHYKAKTHRLIPYLF